jgi:hypothetical protein
VIAAQSKENMLTPLPTQRRTTSQRYCVKNTIHEIMTDPRTVERMLGTMTVRRYAARGYRVRLRRLREDAYDLEFPQTRIDLAS